MGRRAHPYVTPATLDDRTACWLQDIRSEVALRPHLRLVPRRCALLVIDMLDYFVSPGGRAFLPAAPVILPSINRLLDAWRRLDAAVFFPCHGHTGQHDLGMLGKFFADHIDSAEPQAHLVSAITPRAGEPCVRKTTYDAFHGTDLERQLHRRGVTQVLITGVLTHLCCESTARAAFCRGFEVYLAADAMASSTERLHANALLGLADGVAIVQSTEEILLQCRTDVD